jgi:hypothetical protein
MKATVLAASITILFASLSLANDSAMGSVGGTLAPMDEHPSIRLVFEQIDVTQKRVSAKVTCTFVFKNEGEATIVKMGFPEVRDEGNPLGEFEGFRSRIDGKTVEVKPTAWVSEPGGFTGRRWWVKTVRFGRGETRVVENSYSSRTGTDSHGVRFFHYELKTGKNWSGPIGRALITIDTAAVRDHQTFDPEPADCTVEDNCFTWTFTEFEPAEDIRLTYYESYDNFFVDGERRRDYGGALPRAPRIEDGVLTGGPSNLHELFDLDVTVSEEGQALTISGCGTTVRLTAGSTTAFVNDEALVLPRAPELRDRLGWQNGQVMVFPLAPVARAFGATVWLDPETKKTYIWRPKDSKARKLG